MSLVKVIIAVVAGDASRLNEVLFALKLASYAII